MSYEDENRERRALLAASTPISPDAADRLVWGASDFEVMVEGQWIPASAAFATPTPQARKS